MGNAALFRLCRHELRVLSFPSFYGRGCRGRPDHGIHLLGANNESIVNVAVGGNPFGRWHRPVTNQQPPAPVPSRIQKTTDDFYVLLGEGGNTSVYVTDEGVILVDVKFERNFDDIQAKVKSITDKPIKYIFNTHAHGDHTGGNQKFLPAAQIIAHRNARAAMVQGKLPGPPQITYTDEIALNLGGKEVIGHYFGRAHTDGDTWVYFPALRLLAAGDSFNTGNGQGQTGSITYGLFIAPGGSLVDITEDP